jgi:hypothetical protein
MSAPDQLGSDKFSLSLKLGRELLPETAVFAWLSTLCAPCCCCPLAELYGFFWEKKKQNTPYARRTIKLRKTNISHNSKTPKKESQHF